MHSRSKCISLFVGILVFGAALPALSQSSQPIYTAATDTNDITERWGRPDAGSQEEEGAPDLVAGGQRKNIFLKTDNIFVKIGWFVGLGVTVYLSIWLIFRMLLKGRSPVKLFSICFMIFMTLFFGIGFLCFSEYALTHGYNKAESYWPQLQWTYIGISIVIWTLLSLITTTLLKGKV